MELKKQEKGSSSFDQKFKSLQQQWFSLDKGGCKQQEEAT